MAYLNVTEVESALVALSTAYPGQCQRITLPNTTHEGRTSHAIRIANGPLDDRPAILYIGGQHAREWGSCEICINVATDLLEAYTGGTGLVYGGQNYTPSQVQDLLNQTQIFIFPCVNPDGRNHSQTSEALWRGNRNPAYPIGVDINRNYDFLFDYRTAFSPAANPRVSDDPTSEVFHGPFPHSEPETRNVVYLLDSYPQIRWMIDIHSYSELLYHNWGDDQNQTTDPAMNFQNPAFNGLRGLGGDAAYREYIPAADLAQQACLATSMQTALQAVRGKVYDTGQGFDLYATSGTAKDYPYSRHFADPTKTKTMGFLIEWGVTFQPTWIEMERIILDISSALVQFALSAPCACIGIEVELATPSIQFIDIPEGEQAARAIVFNVNTCETLHFQIVSGPTVLMGPGSLGVLPSPTATLPALISAETREARLWISYRGTNDGDSASGSVTVRLLETGEEWIIPITMNTIARPTVAAVLVLDQSGSMNQASGLPPYPKRIDVLKYAAPVFCNLIHENNGIGIVAFDHDAFERMAVETVGPMEPFEPARAAALSTILAHTPNTSGFTAIGDGVEKASELLADTSGYDHRAIVVFTDGHETASKYLSEVTPLINDRVFAIGLGTADQIQPAALSTLTNGTGGFLLLTGNLGSDDLFLLSKYYLQVLAGVTNQDIVLDPEGSLLPGQVHRIPFTLSEADYAMDAILLNEANFPLLKFSLETPDGTVIDPTTLPFNAQYSEFQSTSAYRAGLPMGTIKGAGAGLWHAIIKVDPDLFKRYIYLLKLKKYYNSAVIRRILTHGVRYNLSIHAFSSLRMQARLLQRSLEPGSTCFLNAVLSEYGIPVGSERANVWAEYQQPDGYKGTLRLTETQDQPGVYTAPFQLSLPGVYRFRVLAKGSSLKGMKFTREQLLTGSTWKGGDTPPPTEQPGNGSDCLCDLLKCILENGVIRPELEKKWIDQGLNLRALNACTKR